MAKPTNRLKLNASGAFDDAKIIDFPSAPAMAGRRRRRAACPIRV
jgi:hypothetical protein